MVRIGSGCPIKGTGNSYTTKVEGIGQVVWNKHGNQHIIVMGKSGRWRAVPVTGKELAQHARERLKLAKKLGA